MVSTPMTPLTKRQTDTSPQEWELDENLEFDDEFSASPHPRGSHDQFFSKARKLVNMPSSQRYQRLGLDTASAFPSRSSNRPRGGEVLYYLFLFLIALSGCGLLTLGCADNSFGKKKQVTDFISRSILTTIFSGRSTKQLSVFARLPEWAHSGDKLGHLGPSNDRYPTDITRDIPPIRCHSHNDYWRSTPLLEALHYGCIGVEADVWLRSEDLFIGHSTASLVRTRTFNGLYVKPLVELLDRQSPRTDFYFSNGRRHGVYDTDAEQTLVLLVDFKTDGRELWPVVLQQLEPLRAKKYLSYYNGSHVIPGPVTVVGTGNVPFELVHEAEQREIFFDAPLDKLADGFVPSSSGSDVEPVDTASSGTSRRGLRRRMKLPWPASPAAPAAGTTNTIQFDATNSYYASTNLTEAVGPVLQGRFTDKQLAKVRAQVKAAADRGLKSRYWGTPLWPISTRNYVWRTLMDEGVDILNVDDLPSAALLEW